MLLDTTTKTIEVLMEGAHTTTAPTWVADYADVTSSGGAPTGFISGSADGVLNGTTAVTMVDHPASGSQRRVREISIINVDTVVHTLTVRLNNNGTFRKVQVFNLAVGAVITYIDGLGWSTSVLQSGVPSGGTANQVLTKNSSTDYDSSWATASSGGAAGLPTGRLSLSSGVAVPVSDVTAATSVYYTPYCGKTIPLWSGSALANTAFSEVSQAISDTTKSPAAGAANKNYDMFVWSDSGTIRCTRGPAWSSDTGRGTGAGTTELDFATAGIWTNKVAITNGPAANKGTYVGTIRTDGNTQCNMILKPAGAAGGSVNRLDVWNCYNRRMLSSINVDSTTNWTYGTADVWRIKDNNNNNKILFVIGLQEDVMECYHAALAASSNGGGGWIGIGFDSTTAAQDGSVCFIDPGGANTWASADASSCVYPTIGFHYVAPLEGVAGGTQTFCGSSTPAGTHVMGNQAFMVTIML